MCDSTKHAKESLRIWEANARWWDDRIGDGNEFQNELIEPATERLLAVAPGDRILDIGCGAGRFTRRMASLGATVVAFDFCEAFIERARERTPAETTGIEYHTLDATDSDAVRRLGETRFDKAVATMCLMDMSDIYPLFEALTDVLKPGGLFVFSVLHPCFNSTGDRKSVV
jgi:2-polyprenyl-3-methyl-5-hydroxy-6-metoxy-1,4-benzoquinol methylase